MPQHFAYTIVVPLILLLAHLRRQPLRFRPWAVFEFGMSTVLFWLVSQYAWNPLEGSFTIPPLSCAWTLIRARTYATSESPSSSGLLCWLQILILDVLQVIFVISDPSPWFGIGGAGFLDGLIVHPLLVFFVLTVLPPPRLHSL